MHTKMVGMDLTYLSTYENEELITILKPQNSQF